MGSLLLLILLLGLVFAKGQTGVPNERRLLRLLGVEGLTAKGSLLINIYAGGSGSSTSRRVFKLPLLPAQKSAVTSIETRFGLANPYSLIPIP